MAADAGMRSQRTHNTTSACNARWQIAAQVSMYAQELNQSRGNDDVIGYVAGLGGHCLATPW